MGYTLLGGSSTAAQADEANQLSTGQESLSRMQQTASATLTTGVMRLSYFTARKSEVSTQVRVNSGSSGSSSLTLGRIGLYAIDAAGAGTLVAATVNDTALLGAGSTAYTKSWAASYAMVAGARYALAVLMVGTTPGTIQGITVFAAEAAIAPRLVGALTGQSDLPASFADASLTTSGFAFYGVVLP